MLNATGYFRDQGCLLGTDASPNFRFHWFLRHSSCPSGQRGIISRESLPLNYCIIDEHRVKTEAASASGINQRQAQVFFWRAAELWSNLRLSRPVGARCHYLSRKKLARLTNTWFLFWKHKTINLYIRDQHCHLGLVEPQWEVASWSTWKLNASRNVTGRNSKSELVINIQNFDSKGDFTLGP